MNFSKRRIARIHCMVSLYLYDLGKFSPQDILDGYVKYQDNLGVMADEKVYAFYEDVFKKTVENIKLIDETISEASKRWDTSRLYAIDKAILRMATCELVILKHASVSIVINEAIEIAKFYSPDEEKGPKFINGVLDTVADLAKLK
ncbi:MAG: transcription antitermination factor NusB [Elusimicrobiota bacterium]